MKKWKHVRTRWIMGHELLMSYAKNDISWACAKVSATRPNLVARVPIASATAALSRRERGLETCQKPPLGD